MGKLNVAQGYRKFSESLGSEFDFLDHLLNRKVILNCNNEGRAVEVLSEQLKEAFSAPDSYGKFREYLHTTDTGGLGCGLLFVNNLDLNNFFIDEEVIESSIKKGVFKFNDPEDITNFIIPVCENFQKVRVYDPRIKDYVIISFNDTVKGELLKFLIQNFSSDKGKAISTKPSLFDRHHQKKISEIFSHPVLHKYFRQRSNMITYVSPQMRELGTPPLSH